MAEFPVLPLYTDAYMGDTRHLTCLEHGAYLQLLMVAWRTGDASLPNDERFIARCCGLTLGQWRRIRHNIVAFFALENGRLVQERLRDELNHVRQVRQSQIANGRASALKRKERHSTKRVAPLNEASTPSTSTSTIIERASLSCPKAMKVVEAWNVLAGKIGVPKARKPSPALAAKIEHRIKEHGIEEIVRAIAGLERSQFIPSKWRPDLGVMMGSDKCEGMVNGRYGGGGNHPKFVMPM